MTALVRIICDCNNDSCGRSVDVSAQTTSQARSEAKDVGWDCDSIGGTTVDLAPGHQWPRKDAA